MEENEPDAESSLTFHACNTTDVTDMLFEPNGNNVSTAVLEGYASDMYCLDDPSPALLRGQYE